MPACHWTPLAVEAEEVRRLHGGGGVPRAGRAVHERLRRMLLGVVGHGDGLVARERPDHHVGTELLHEPLGLLDRRVSRVVRAADAHELERVATDRPSVPSCGRLVGVVRLRPAELRNGRDRPADVLLVVRGERAAAVGQDRELDRRCRRRADGCGRSRRGRNGYHCHGQAKQQPTAWHSRMNHVRPPRSFSWMKWSLNHLQQQRGVHGLGRNIPPLALPVRPAK